MALLIAVSAIGERDRFLIIFYCGSLLKGR